MWPKNLIKSSPFFSATFRRPPFLYSPISKTLKSLQSASISERENASSKLLEEALVRAMQTPFGKSIGSPRNLESWPICDKHTLREHGHKMATKGLKPFVKSTSGGTTGIPVQLDLSLHAIALEQALLDFLVEPHSVDWLTSKVAVLRGDSIERSSSTNEVRWQFQNGGNRLHFDSNSLNKNNISDFVRKLEDFKPDILWVYPNVLRQFFQLLGGQEHHIKPKLVFSSSEVFDNQVINEVREKLNCENIVDYYGQAERGCSAYSLGDARYHFVTAYGFVELLFERTEGDVDLYRIITTPYWNKSFGLVRLDTGDLACLPKGTSEEDVRETALGVQPFLGIYGRKNDYLVSPSGDILVGIDHIHKGNKSISQLQVVQNSPHTVELLVIPNGEFLGSDADQLVFQARKKIPSTMHVTVKTTDALNKSPSGKVPFVVRTI